MSNTLPSFQRYQLAFTAHLRDPKRNPIPAGVAPERMAVYEEVVFNNLFESVSACFPVAQQVLGKRAWLKLNQAFMREHSANSPIFREIPQEFLAFLTQEAVQATLPPYLYSLCHYEWVELLVSTMPAQTIDANPHGHLLSASPVFNETLQLLQYDYAVHKITARKKPIHPISTQLLVYRNHQNEVKFIETNASTLQLIQLLQAQNMTSQQALKALAHALKHPNSEVITAYGLSILEDLKNQGVILGTRYGYDK